MLFHLSRRLLIDKSSSVTSGLSKEWIGSGQQWAPRCMCFSWGLRHTRMCYDDQSVRPTVSHRQTKLALTQSETMLRRPTCILCWKQQHKPEQFSPNLMSKAFVQRAKHQTGWPSNTGWPPIALWSSVFILEPIFCRVSTLLKVIALKLACSYFASVCRDETPQNRKYTS